MIAEMENTRPSAYPVELAAPDLTPFAAGNRGIPYLYSFDSGHAGPHVMINALTHGNEICGAIALAELLRHGLRPQRGRLTLSFANVAAFARFDPARPDASRFVDQDFNRVWSEALLDDPGRQSSELDRARALRPVVDTADLLLDLHSMHERCEPLDVCGPLAKGIAFARQLGTPAAIISDAGHPEGRRMRDYAGFGDPASAKNALLIECGQHWERSALTVARAATARFLLLAGVVDEAALPIGWLQPLPAAQRVIEVSEAVVATSMDFRFAAAFKGLECLPKQGTVIAYDAGRPVLTPYPDCVLVMPSLRQLRPGVTVVRLGRLRRD
jgi:predicted deacylase